MSNNYNLLTFRDHRMKLNQDICQKKIQKALTQDKKAGDEDTLVTTVDVSIMNLKWMVSDNKNFLDFIKILKDTKNKAILQTAFVNSLFETFWSKYQARIFYTQMLPFIFYLISTIQFLVWNFTKGDKWFRGGDKEEIFYFVLFGFNAVLATNLILVEFI